MLSTEEPRPPRDLAGRLESLETSQAFCERASEQLGEQVLHLQRRVIELAQRLSVLESNLGRVSGLLEGAPRDRDADPPPAT